MEKYNKETNVDELLACGCGHCHDNYQKNNNDCKNKRKIFGKYTFDFIKVLLSLFLLLISVVFKLNSKVDLILCLIATIICGYDLIYKFIKNILRKQLLDENTLMLIAVIVAFFIGEFFESVLIVSLYKIGELLEQFATDNSKKKIVGLSELKTDVVRLVTREGIIEVAPSDVQVGSLIEVRSGDKVPIDGTLVGLPTEFDLRAITGESKYYLAENGSVVYSGAINVGSPVIIKTSKKHEDSTVERMISMVQGSLSKKAKSQRFITYFAKIYTPIIVACAFLLALLPPLFDNMNFIKWLYKSLSFLVISCPCALVISIPLAFFVGIGSLAKIGILVKGSNYIETLSKTKCIVFDKTGTLTKGNFIIQEIKINNGYDKDLIMSYVKVLESKSSHPIAMAISKYPIDCSKLDVEDIKEIAGRGICGTVNGRKICVGNEKFMLENNAEIIREKTSKTVLYVLLDGVFVAEIVIGDEIKNDAEKCIESLRKNGVEKVVMLSGDNKEIAESVGVKLNIDKVYSELLPEQKASILKEIKNQTKGAVVYVGDGVNDSPSLAMSDVGVSMGGLGSELVIESSDAVIMDDDIKKIPTAIKFSKKIRRTVLQNVIGSLVVKFSIMLLSLIVNLPVWLAMFTDVGVMVLAVLNSIKNNKVKQ